MDCRWVDGWIGSQADWQLIGKDKGKGAIKLGSQNIKQLELLVECLRPSKSALLWDFNVEENSNR